MQLPGMHRGRAPQGSYSCRVGKVGRDRRQPTAALLQVLLCSVLTASRLLPPTPHWTLSSPPPFREMREESRNQLLHVRQ